MDPLAVLAYGAEQGLPLTETGTEQFLRIRYVIADVSNFSLTTVYSGISFYGKCIVLLVATNRL